MVPVVAVVCPKDGEEPKLKALADVPNEEAGAVFTPNVPVPEDPNAGVVEPNVVLLEAPNKDVELEPNAGVVAPKVLLPNAG